jgi:hypothetical protein
MKTEEKISKNSGGYSCGYTKRVYQLHSLIPANQGGP